MLVFRFPKQTTKEVIRRSAAPSSILARAAAPRPCKNRGGNDGENNLFDRVPTIAGAGLSRRTLEADLKEKVRRQGPARMEVCASFVKRRCKPSPLGKARNDRVARILSAAKLEGRRLLCCRFGRRATNKKDAELRGVQRLRQL